jgi:hypothetical protein
VRWSYSRWRAGEPQTPADRRFRLFACACCRRVWDRIPEPCNRDAVLACEGFLDGQLPSAALEAAFTASSRVEYLEDGSKRGEPGYWAVKYLGRGFYKLTAGASALMVASRTLSLADEAYGREARHAFDDCFDVGNGVFLAPFRWPEPIPPVVLAERVVYADLLRCIFGTPSREQTFDPSWRTETAVSLARQMYESRDFLLMPILGDALADAGCPDGDVLEHCRGPGPHSRGCWVADLVLGKS